jgi:hypothetical protein
MCLCTAPCAPPSLNLTASGGYVTTLSLSYYTTSNIMMSYKQWIAKNGAERDLGFIWGTILAFE